MAVHPVMKTILPIFGFALLSLGLATAQQPASTGPGWKDLFKPDLSNAEKPEGVWSVKDGEITANADQTLWALGEFENFSLDLEFKTADGTNSGVVIYCTDTKNWIPHSVEIQIADDFSEEWSKQPGSWHCAAIFGHLAPTKSLVKKPGEWNRMTIEAKGQRVKVWLNGELTTDMDMAKWTSAKKNPDGSEIPSWLSTPFAEMKTKGRIGFQGKHAKAQVWFRNIRLKAAE